MDWTPGLLSRRGALRIAGSAALAAGTVGLGSDAGRAETRPSPAMDFHGTWNGNHNGRDATLSTALTQRGVGVFQVTCTLLDHASAETHVGVAGHVGDRELTDVTLRGARGGREITWRALRLHTWRHDPVSGVSWWTEDPEEHPFFGLSLYRDPSAPHRAAPAVMWHNGGSSGPAAVPRASLGVFDGPGDQFLLHLDRS